MSTEINEIQSALKNLKNIRDQKIMSDQENNIKNQTNFNDYKKPSFWEVASRETRSNTNLVRGKSTPNINDQVNNSDLVVGSATQRMGSHISSKIRQLQLCQESQEGRKRHVSESDTSTNLESQTSTATFKDARQIVFLEEIVTPPQATPRTLPVKLIASPITPQTLPVNSATGVEGRSPITPKSPVVSAKASPSIAASAMLVASPTTHVGRVPSISVDDSSDTESEISQEIIVYQKPPEHLHSETIRIKTTSESEQTLELTVTVSQKSTTNHAENEDVTEAPSSILSPTKRRQFSLDDKDSKPYITPRRSFVFPNFLKLLPSSLSDRRNSAPTRIKPSKLPDTEDIEILNFKLEAVAVNAAYLLARAQDFCGTIEQLIELEDEIERTQRALDDVEVMAPPNMRAQVARATRALDACKMCLEERAPSIETLEIGEYRRRSSSAVSAGDVRSVSMRVMKLNKEAEKRRSSCHDSIP